MFIERGLRLLWVGILIWLVWLGCWLFGFWFDGCGVWFLVSDLMLIVWRFLIWLIWVVGCVLFGLDW